MKSCRGGPAYPPQAFVGRDIFWATALPGTDLLGDGSSGNGSFGRRIFGRRIKHPPQPWRGGLLCPHTEGRTRRYAPTRNDHSSLITHHFSLFTVLSSLRYVAEATHPVPLRSARVQALLVNVGAGTGVPSWQRLQVWRLSRHRQRLYLLHHQAS